MIGPVIFVIGGMVALFVAVYLIERSPKSQEQTGRPSHWVRPVGILVMIGIAAGVWFGGSVQCLAILGIIILLGYGTFSYFGNVRSRPIDESQEIMGTSDNVALLSRKGLARNTKIVIGCGTAIITAIMLICAGTGYFIYTLRDPGTLDIDVIHPKTVHVGESLELALNLKNNGDADIHVQDVSISPAIGGNYESILAGTIVTRTEPAMESYEVPLLNMRVYPYNQVIKPGETHKVVFYFKAVKPGEFHTDILVDLGNGKSTVWDIVIPIIY